MGPEQVSSVFFGVVSLMAAQFLAVVGGAVIYMRQKSALDIEKRDRGILGPRVDKALQAASDALLGVERVDIEQYKALSKRLAEYVQEIEMLKVKISGLEESVRNLSNKLASRDRADHAFMKRMARDGLDDAAPQAANPQVPVQVDPENFRIPEGVDPGEYIRAMGIGVPVGAPAFQQQTLPLGNNNVERPAFGRTVRRS